MKNVAMALPDSLASRFGQAVHSLLELWTADSPAFSKARLARVAREFQLPDSSVRDAAAMAQRILAGEGAWAWQGSAIDWQGNEVALLHQGELLRLDRLVRRSDTGEWWVLDYKSATQPQAQQALLEQMRRYRQAVQAAYPGAAVKAAFLTGQGRLVAVE